MDTLQKFASVRVSVLKTLFNGAPPPKPQHLQRDPSRHSCRVALPSRGLIDTWGWGYGDWFAFVLKYSAIF